MISPHRLRVLKAVLAAGSLHGAARNLHYSPATVSQHMTELSRETGLELFVRRGRGLDPRRPPYSWPNRRRRPWQSWTGWTVPQRICAAGGPSS